MAKQKGIVKSTKGTSFTNIDSTSNVSNLSSIKTTTSAFGISSGSKTRASYTVIESPNETKNKVNLKTTEARTVSAQSVIKGSFAGFRDADDKVKIDANDPQASHLLNKIKEGEGIIIEAKIGDDLNRFLEISAKKTLFLVDAITPNQIINFSNTPAILDGLTLSIGDRVLLKDQVLEKDNGIYTVMGPIEHGVTSGTWVRSTDANDYDKFKTGALVFGCSGEQNYHKLFFFISEVSKSDWNFEDKTFATLTGLILSGDIFYNNLNSTLNAINVQDAIDELDNKIENLETDKNLEYLQVLPSASWLIVHNMEKLPSVTIADLDGNVYMAEIKYIDENSLYVNFSENFTGKAILN